MIAITGYSGFIGAKLLDMLPPNECLLLGRRPIEGAFQFCYMDLSNINNTPLEDLLSGVSVLIHVAGDSGIGGDIDSQLGKLKDINVDGTYELAKKAALAGVHRFVYISSIKVNGESTTLGQAYSERSATLPTELYGKSKLSAELGLKKVGIETTMEVVIVRPPLVYGPGVKSNFMSLIKLVSSNIPLPFGAIKNKRSMVYLDNLVDLLIRCIDHPNAANQTFIVSDGRDLSLAELVWMMRSSMDKPAWLLPVPVGLFKLIGKITGKMTVVDRLVGNLQVDSSKAQQELDWVPPYTVEQGIAETVKDFMNRKK